MRCALLTLLLLAAAALPSAAQSVPQLPFESVPNPLTLPDDIHFGEIAGVAVNSKGHVFVFSRGNSTGPSYMATAVAAARVRCQGQVRPRDRQEPLRLVVRARRPHRQGRQHLGRRQGLGHDPEAQPAGPRRLGVRPQGRGVALHGAARLRAHADGPAQPRRRRGHAAGEQQPAQPGAGASRQRLQPADRRGVGLPGQFVLQRRLRQLARRQGQCAWRVGGELGLARQRPRSVRHAARHRGVAEGRGLRRRSRQPPHPGVRSVRQVHPPVHHRRAGADDAARSSSAKPAPI